MSFTKLRDFLGRLDHVGQEDLDAAVARAEEDVREADQAKFQQMRAQADTALQQGRAELMQAIGQLAPEAQQLITSSIDGLIAGVRGSLGSESPAVTPGAGEGAAAAPAAGPDPGTPADRPAGDIAPEERAQGMGPGGTHFHPGTGQDSGNQPG